MKLSDYLNVTASVLTLVFIIFLFVQSIKTDCFSWLEYGVSFIALFTNLGINILASLGS